MPGPPSRAPFERAPVPLLCAAGLLSAALLASCAAPDGTGEEAPDEEDERLAVEADPQDAAAVAQEAVALAQRAESFESAYFMRGAELGDPPWQEFVYTEDPEPVYRYTDRGGPAVAEIIEVGEGPDDVIRNHRMQNEGAEDAFYREPEDGNYDSWRAQWEYWLERIPESVEDALDLSYEGVAGVGADEGVAGDPLLEESPVAEEPGHLYTGSLPSSIEEGELDEHRFHLWIGEDGYPQLLYVHESWSHENEDVESHSDEYVLFEQFGEPVGVEVPDDSEIGEGHPQSHP